MERNFPGFTIVGRRTAREDLAKTNEVYVKQMALKKYWDALIPKTKICCKRKVLDTNYLTCLRHPNVELIPNDAVKEITKDGVQTQLCSQLGLRHSKCYSLWKSEAKKASV